MSNSGGDGEQHSEIIIVHRHGDHDEGHHGGAWKIAFADFMTAMMTFFLVMWLINSADEQTLAQVANYFSPIKLTDRTVTIRGVHDAEFGSGGTETEDQKQRKKEGKSPVESKQEPGERRFPGGSFIRRPLRHAYQTGVAGGENPAATGWRYAQGRARGRRGVPRSI